MILKMTLKNAPSCNAPSCDALTVGGGRQGECWGRPFRTEAVVGREIGHSFGRFR